MISVNSRLALAIRRLNAEYGKLPKSAQDAVNLDSIGPLETAIDTAMAAGDDSAALAAVERWESRCLQSFEEASR